MDQYTAILFSIVSAALMGIPLGIIEKLFSLKYNVTKLFGYIIFSATLIICMYSTITIAALLGISESNKWAFNYFTSFSLDFFMINPMVNYIKISLYYMSLKSANFFSKLI
jgi:hypothetical protein